MTGELGELAAEGSLGARAGLCRLITLNTAEPALLQLSAAPSWAAGTRAGQQVWALRGLG